MASSLAVYFAEQFDGETVVREDHGATEIPFDGMRDLLEQNRLLQEAIAVLRDMPKGAAIGDPRVQQAIQSADSAANSINPHIEALWEQIPAQQKPALHTNNKAREVFEVPELLEHILLQLPTEDILAAQGVAKVWQSGVQASINIKHALSLAPNDQASYHTLFAEGMPGFSYFEPRIHNEVMTEWKLYRVDNELKIQIGINLTQKIKIGATWEAMLLCQPPIKSAVLSFQARGSIDYDRYPYGRYDLPGEDYQLDMANVNGLTVGDLLLAARVLRDHCETDLDNEAGEKLQVRTMYMTATLNLNKHDPIMAAREAYVKRTVDSRDKRLRRQQKLLAAREGQYDYDSGSDHSSDCASYYDFDPEVW